MKIVTTFVIILLGIISCSKNESFSADFKEEISQKDVSFSFHKDVEPSFYKYFLDDRKLMLKLNADQESLNSFISIFSDQRLDPSEVPILTKLSGFRSDFDMKKYYSTMNEFYKKNRHVTYASIETKLKGELFSDEISNFVNPCTTIKNNCLIAVAAEAGIMHIACAALDPTVIAGIICHGLAITWQITQGNICISNAQTCNGSGPQ